MISSIRSGAAILAAGAAVVAAPVASATGEGGLLVPGDIAPGYYWANPSGNYDGYVEVCSDYTCEIGGGLIRNYSVVGRTMVAIPINAALVNVQRANLTPVQPQSAPATASGPAAGLPKPLPAGAPGPKPCDSCSELHLVTQDALGQTMWCNPLMTGDHSLHWMYGGAA